MNYTFEVLLSCMYQTDFSLIEKSNLNDCKTLLINQCETENEEITSSSSARMLNSASRGLSVSRNLALVHAEGDICLLSDDDEMFVDGLEDKIVSQYYTHPQADVIIFKMKDRLSKLGDNEKNLKKLDVLRVSSWQISFKRESIIKHNIWFDINLGAGTGNGGGEENKFLIDCQKKKLSIYYVPIEIASVAQTDSTWFFGYDGKYFYSRGRSTRYILGLPLAILYACYFLIFNNKLYREHLSMLKAAKQIYKGMFSNVITNDNN